MGDLRLHSLSAPSLSDLIGRLETREGSRNPSGHFESFRKSNLSPAEVQPVSRQHKLSGTVMQLQRSSSRTGQRQWNGRSIGSSSCPEMIIK
tara:strand:- start:332 stop:607 length:276 start_codon:yes stop_codon:yes gene_type:complete